MRIFVCRKCTVPCVIGIISGLLEPMRCMVSFAKVPQWREVYEDENTEAENGKID